MKQRLTAGLFAALVLALAAFTGSAFAGGGNGNGSDGSNGNSANAPGHHAPAAPPAAPQPAAAPAPAAPAQAAAPAKAVKQSKQSSTSASQPAAGGTNSTGVKPSSSTTHDTYAKASSNQTKQYGNGKTAGQIATQAGYGDATLHGPGNSQPHKVLCGGHEVDVHALKHKGSKCGTATQGSAKDEQKSSETKSTEAAVCATTTTTVTEQVLVGVKHMTGPKGSGRYVVIHPNVKSAHYDKSKHADDVPIYETVTKTVTVPAGNSNCSPAQVSSSQVTSSSTAGTQATQAATTPPVAGTQAAATAAPASGVAGVQATRTNKPAVAPAATPSVPSAGGVKGAVIALKPTAKPKAAGGVLGTTTRLGHTVASTQLPFTGLPLWIFTVGAALLIALGFTLRRSTADRI